MNQLNRTVAPETQPIKNLQIPLCNRTEGKSGIPIYSLTSTTDEVLRVEFVFDAGLNKQTQKAVANAVNALLTEGTLTRNAKDIADSLDFYGSYFQSRCAVDDAQLTLYCLKKHLAKCLVVVEDVIKNAQYPDSELDIYKKNNKQRLKVQQQKTSYQCRRAYYQTIFGESNPIASFSNSVDYDNFSRETLLNFHQNNYSNSLKYITVSGDVDAVVLQNMKEFSSSFTVKSDQIFYQSKGINSESKYIKKEKSVQATLRVGRQLFNRTHQDFRKLQLTNMILGGYFGSRLMKNIREDKGLTYGIYSVLESYLDDGCFYIEADVNTKKSELALKEIRTELTKLCSDLVEDKELNQAKNYFLGSILRGIDGPFSIMDRNRIMIDYGFENTYYNELLEIINTTTASEIRDLCAKYFEPTNLVEIVCGG